MADFVRIKDQDVWINLDYVIRIESNADEAGSATVTFADGSAFAISNADAKRLLKHLQPPKKKKKKKKKTPAAPETPEPVAAVMDDESAPPAE